MDEKNIIIKLNNLGLEFKSDSIGKNVSYIIELSCIYFCEYFCRYASICNTCVDDNIPWCPIDELK